MDDKNGRSSAIRDKGRRPIGGRQPPGGRGGGDVRQAPDLPARRPAFVPGNPHFDEIMADDYGERVDESAWKARQAGGYCNRREGPTVSTRHSFQRETSALCYFSFSLLLSQSKHSSTCPTRPRLVVLPRGRRRRVSEGSVGLGPHGRCVVVLT